VIKLIYLDHVSISEVLCYVHCVNRICCRMRIHTPCTGVLVVDILLDPGINMITYTRSTQQKESETYDWDVRRVY
jgi:hypothetical protein